MKLISAPGERRRFIYGIVRRVMEAYYNRLNESYHSFASRVESVVRSVPGTMYGQETSELAGTEGQERFSRLISSCYYAKKLAQEMDDDLVRRICCYGMLIASPFWSTQKSNIPGSKRP